MAELIGKECRCVFDLPAVDWPIPGYPAWVIVDAVDMPMLKIRSKFAGQPFWINVSAIRSLDAVQWFPTR